MTIKVTGLYVYPIKGCRSMSMHRVSMSLRGLAYDREWMLVGTDGKFLSQRSHPRMCLIEAEVQPDDLIIRAPGMPSFCLPLTQPDDGLLDVRVHKDACKGIGQGARAAAWFSAFLGTPCQLVRTPPESVHVRRSKSGLGAVGFADAYQLLLISQGSLDDLNARLETPVPMDRFRPNIVVSGAGAYAEDAWGEIAVASVRLSGGDLCVRCAVTQVDQATGEKGIEPLATLAGYRRTSAGAVFGRNFCGRNGGQIDLGSTVDIAPPY